MAAFSSGVELFRRDMMSHTIITTLLSLFMLIGTVGLYVPSVVIFPYVALVTAHMYRLRIPTDPGLGASPPVTEE